MAEAGYPNGEGFPEVELLSRDSPSERIPNEAIQAMLKSRLNVDSTIKLLDSATHGEALNAGATMTLRPLAHTAQGSLIRSGFSSRDTSATKTEMIEGVTR